MRWILILFLVALESLSAISCAGGQRVVLVKTEVEADRTPTNLIRIGPDVQGKVYVLVNGEWELSQNEVEIPEGWYCAPVGGK